MGRRKGSDLRTPFALLLICALFAQGAVAVAAPAGAPPAQAAPFSASYQASPPATMGAGADVAVPITLTNTGTETWKPFAPPATGPAVGDVAISYHWYTPQGAVAVWDGLRSPLGVGDVAPGTSRATIATVRAPAQAGPYILRFALVKEGVQWAAPSQSFAAQVNPAYSASFMRPTVHALLLGKSYTFAVTVTNTGTVAWTSSGASPVNLSYHWHDQRGSIVRWDGERTPLEAEVAPGAAATLQMTLTAPATGGTYRLTIDMVREGVGWFSSFGGTVPLTMDVVVAPIHFAAQYSAAFDRPPYVSETRTLPVTVTNTGNVPWGGSNPVNLAYHIHDARGMVVVWDGTRTPLGDVAVGASKTVELTYTAPAVIGDYTLTVNAVREGIGWLGSSGAPTRLAMAVGRGYGIGYGASTTPGSATIGARILVNVIVDNYGPRTLVSKGANAVRLSYHIFGTNGTVVTWDGIRGLLPDDLPAGASVSVPIEVQLPSRVGDYVIKWDLVQEGVAWFSGYGITSKEERITVQPGVTFYGKGFGHGLGMSQWGAQGMATGAAGPPATGEQIVAHYYRGTTLLPISADNPNQRIRVLLSAPSSISRYSCGAAFFDGTLASLTSAGGFQVLNVGQGDAAIAVSPAGGTVQIQAAGGRLTVFQNGAAVWSGNGPVLVVPLDPAVPINFQEKGTYRGEFRFTNLGGTLRVINILGYDEYIKAVIPLEMPARWHIEAYRAQALAARTYAYQSWRGTASDFDVHDDQSDQCYGGVQMRSGRVVETGPTNQAVDSTARLLITHNGAAIRAYFSSSSGGYTKPEGCWGFNVIISSSGSVSCRASKPYLTSVPDPADLAVSVPGLNAQRSWQVTFTSDQVRQAIIRYRGVDIGPLVSVDLSNRDPAVVGHVVSVKIVGQFLSLDLPADRLLRDHLFLKSTLVRLSAW